MEEGSSFKEAKMPSKTQFYAQLAAETAGRLTESLQAWTAFLETSARLYKYPYYEQLLIFAQKPEATAWAFTMFRATRVQTKTKTVLKTPPRTAVPKNWWKATAP